MKVELKVSRAGTRFSQSRGDVVDIDDKEALRMIEAGHAVAVRDGGDSPEKTNKSNKAEKAKK